MTTEQLLQTHYKKLAREGKLKAALIGIIIGFGVDFVACVASWYFVSALWLWLSIALGAVCGVFAGFFSYFRFFRPTQKSVARRLDSLGLEERAITMAELEGNDSFMAMRQREDAAAHIGRMDAKKVGFGISAVIIALAIAIGLLGVGATAVDALTVLEVIPSSGEIFPEPLTPADYVLASYAADEGGALRDASGETATGFEYDVVKGEDAPVVIAVAQDGWIFDSWSDGVLSPVRTDKEMQEDVIVTAFFFEMDEEQPEEDDEGDKEAGGGGGGFGAGGSGGEPGDNTGHGVSGGRYEPSNRVYDGNTPYQDVLDDYYDEAMEELSKNPNLTEEQRAMLEAYYRWLKSNAEDKTEEENSEGN